MRKLDPRSHVERFQGRLLAENGACRKNWDKHDASAGEGKRPPKLSPEEAHKRAVEVARRNEEN